MLRVFILICWFGLMLASRCDAQSVMRQWTSGKFKIQAKFVSLKDGVVTLSKFDGKKLEIPLEKLSDDDRAFVEGVAGVPADPDNPFQVTTILPPIGKKKGDAWMAPDFAKLRRVPGLSKKDKNSWQLTPQSPSVELADSVQLPKFSFHERVNGSAISVNGQWMALSIHDPFGGARIHLLNLKEGTLVASVTIPKPQGNASLPIVQGVSADGKYILTGHDWTAKEDTAMKVTLWSVEGEELSPAIEWSPFDTGTTKWHEQRNSRVTWAGFPSSNRVLLQAGGYVVAWDLTTGKPQYQAGLNARSIRFTPDGRYALAASPNAIGVMEVPAGKILFFRDINASGGIDLSPDGTKLLCDAGGNIEIIEVSTGKSLKQIRVESSGGSYWAGNRHILVGGRSLLDVEQEFVCWHYTGHQGTFSAGGKLWFLASDDSSAVLRSHELPHPAALAKIEEALQDPAFFLLQPGAGVNIEVQLPAEQEKVKATLILKIEAAGFKYDPNASLSFVATKQAGQTEEITVRDFGSIGFGGEKHQFTPQIVSLDLMESGKSVWRRSHQGYLPGIFDVRDGETRETALRRYEDPGLGLYESVNFPKFIVRPGKAGETKVTTSSLQ